MKNIVIFDLDGTLALDHHRRHHLTIKCPECLDWDDVLSAMYTCQTCKGKGVIHNWDKYFAACHGDVLNIPVAVILNQMEEAGLTVHILTGRSDSVRGQTEDWLNRHEISAMRLRMRPADNRVDDHILKIGWGAELGGPDRVLFVVEDRTRVVKAWREAGYTCLQCAQGDF